jgi:hypothetical protein
MPGQDGVHGGALDADSAAVYQPDLGETRLVRRFDVVGNDVADVLRREGVEVERALNRQWDDRIVVPQSAILNQSAIRRLQSSIQAFS